MADKWEQSAYPNIQYKKHPTRKNGVKKDRYFRGSYQVRGKRKGINFGYESEGWSEKDAYERIQKYKKNAKAGSGPVSLAQENEIAERAKAEQDRLARLKEKAKVTVSDFFDTVYYPKIEKEKKPGAVEREESLFRIWIKPEIGNKKFDEILRSDVENIYHSIKNAGRAIRTIEYALMTLGQIWKHAKNEKTTAADMPEISKPLKTVIARNDNARVRFLSFKEAVKLLEELEKKSVMVYEKALISLDCGLRAGEINGLRWSRVDLENRILNIIDSKGKDRAVYMTKRVYAVFAGKEKGRAADLVFPGRGGVESGQVSETFREIANRLFNEGVTDRRELVTFHTLRHTCASWLVMDGIDLFIVQKLLGHSSIRVTERYSHLAPGHLQKAAGAMDAINKRK